MSTELKTMQHTGSRDVELRLTRFYGGEKVGTCLQLTGPMEMGGVGYVQISKKDMLRLIRVWEKDIGPLGVNGTRISMNLSGRKL